MLLSSSSLYEIAPPLTYDATHGHALIPRKHNYYKMKIIKLNLRPCWYLFCLFSFVFCTYKAVRPSAESKNQESIGVEVPPNGHTLGHAGAAPVIRSRRAQQFSNSYNYSVDNFSTTTIIHPYVSDHESFCNTVASLQWVGSPPYHVSHILLNYSF